MNFFDGFPPGTLHEIRLTAVIARYIGQHQKWTSMIQRRAVFSKHNLTTVCEVIQIVDYQQGRRGAIHYRLLSRLYGVVA